MSRLTHRPLDAPLLLQVVMSPADLAELEWQDQALCAEVDPELFFVEKGAPTAPAKRVCRSCEVRSECLEYALDHQERWGVWGGLSERERRRLERERADQNTRPGRRAA